MDAISVFDFAALGAVTGYGAGTLYGLAIDGTTIDAEPLVKRFALGGAAGGALQGGITGMISTKKTKDCQDE